MQLASHWFDPTRNQTQVYSSRGARSHRWPSGNSVCLVSYRLGFDSELGLTNDFKIGIHSNVENKPASALVVPLGWALSGIMLTKVLC